jgi:hypothetical protein
MGQYLQGAGISETMEDLNILDDLWVSSIGNLIGQSPEIGDREVMNMLLALSTLMINGWHAL